MLAMIVVSVCVGYSGAYAEIYDLWIGKAEVIYDTQYKYYGEMYVVPDTSPAVIRYMPNKYETVYMGEVRVIGKSAFSGQDELRYINIPRVLKEIKSNAFENTSELKTIDLPYGLRIIGSSAFLNSGLEEIVIPGTVEKIEPLTFSGNNHLEKVVIQHGVESIGARAFSTLRLEEIHIPETVETIDPLALDLNGLDHVILYTTEGSVADDYGKRNHMQIIYVDDDGNPENDEIYQSFATLEVIRDNIKKKSKEHVNFVDLNSQVYPSGVYEVENWNKKSKVSFTSNTEDDFALATWYLIKKGDQFEPVSMFDGVPEAEYVRTDEKRIATISAPKNISVFDKEGNEYTENSPELYGLISCYHSEKGDTGTLKAKITLVKYTDIAKANSGLNSAGQGFPIAAELHALEANDGMPPDLPITEEDFAQLFLYMTKNNIFEHRVHLMNARFDVATTADFKDKMAKGFRLAVWKYPEYMAYTHSYSYTISGAGLGCYVTYSLESDDYTLKEVEQMQLLFQIRTKGYLEALRKSGKFSDDMTEREKAKAIYEWVILFADYDLDLETVSHTGFGLMDNSIAVCEGYAATYNMMCRNAGINIQGCVGEPKGNAEKNTHMWSLAELDGERVHIDSTWGDPTDPSYPDDHINYDYFALKPEVMGEDHSWDEEIFGE